MLIPINKILFFVVSSAFRTLSHLGMLRTTIIATEKAIIKTMILGFISSYPLLVPVWVLSNVSLKRQLVEEFLQSSRRLEEFSSLFFVE